MSDDLDQAKIFFIDVQGRPPVQVQVEFRDFHNFNLAYHCGTAITLTGTGKVEGDQYIVTKVSDVKSLFGKLPGSQNG